MQIKVTASLLLVLSFVSGVVWLFASRADARLAPLPQASSSALPAPRSMVVFDSIAMATTPGSSLVALPPGGSVTVATVPTNRWLVITDYDQSRGYSVDLVEDLAGVITVKRHEMIDDFANYTTDRFHSSVGLSFAPGSQVVLRNRSSFSVSLGYHLAGYWVAP
jgi:hypothetical protein